MTRTYCVIDTRVTPLETIDLGMTCVSRVEDVRRSKDQRFGIVKLAREEIPAFTDGHMLFSEAGIRAFLAERADEW